MIVTFTLTIPPAWFHTPGYHGTKGALIVRSRYIGTIFALYFIPTSIASEGWAYDVYTFVIHDCDSHRYHFLKNRMKWIEIWNYI